MIKLKKGDVVDIVAPASFSDESILIQALSELNKWGLKVKTHINFEAFHPFHSDDDDVRMNDLIHALSKSDSKVIWCLRGGYGSARLLEQLSKIKKINKNKILIGYSDITALHSLLNQKYKMTSIHGPMISSFSSKEFDQRCMKELKDILFSSPKSYKFELEPLNDLADLSKGVIKGSLTGGNLSVVQSLIGTKFEIKSQNKILVLEDVNERGYKLDRMLSQLKMSSSLKGCKAIIFGDFTKGDEPSGENFVDFALMRFALDVKIPVYRTNEFGHGNINRALVFNHSYLIKNAILETKL